MAKAVAAHRERLGLSRPGLARKLEIDRTYLWRIERGAVRPSLRVLDALCAAFGVSLDELRGRVHTERTSTDRKDIGRGQSGPERGCADERRAAGGGR